MNVTILHRCAVLCLSCLLPTFGLIASAWSRVDEDFSTNPFNNENGPDGWQRFGNASLFVWDPDRRAINVTWDSQQPNSYLFHRLPSTLTRRQSFKFGFTLELTEHAIGVVQDQPGTFQIAAGLINTQTALGQDVQRAVLFGSSNLVEWTWFGADTAISPSVSPVIVPQDGRLPWGFSDSFVTLVTGHRYAFDLAFDADAGRLELFMTVDDLPGPPLSPVILPSTFTDFTVNAFSIHSYSGHGQNPLYAGSVRARGWIHSVYWEVPATQPPSPHIAFVGSAYQRSVDVSTETGWIYSLESSHEGRDWEVLNSQAVGDGTVQRLIDPRRVVFPHHLYRVRVSLP